jgi:hypothetical protein
MNKAEAQALADNWASLHRERWTDTIEYTPDNERLAWVAMKRHIAAFAPDGDGHAAALRVPDGPPFVAFLGGRALLIFRLARLVETPRGEPAAEVEVRQLSLAPERCSLAVRAVLNWDRVAYAQRQAVWILRVESHPEVVFETCSPLPEGWPSDEEVFRRALAAAVEWTIPPAPTEADRRAA